MLVEGIKSRPVYTTLSPRAGRAHVVVAEGEGALAVVDLIAAADADFAERAHVIHLAPGIGAGSPADELSEIRVATLERAASEEALAATLGRRLDGALMGTQVYLAGSEAFIARTMLVAFEAGVDHSAIQAEHRGSLERRVQCVHCKAITDHVRTQPVRCSGCGLMLLVRDHYSRRIGAFQGVCIDAEEPGTAPPPEEIFA
jgi:hypothetical protein